MCTNYDSGDKVKKIVILFFSRWIESQADYIKVHNIRNEEFSSKEKIGALEEGLPDLFIRIH